MRTILASKKFSITQQDYQTDENLALCVAMISHYLVSQLRTDRKNGKQYRINQEWFTKAQVNPQSVDHFIEDVSALTATLATRFLSRNEGPSDITWFRDKPVCRLRGDILFALDIRCLTEKLDSGIFWRAHNSLPSKKEKDGLHNHWGVAFENYINWLLGEACQNSKNRFYPSPRFTNGEQVCDAIIVCGSDAVFLEYKGSTFTAESKYQGDLNKLAAEIENKLIGTQSRRKGIRQLAHATLRVFDKQTPAAITNLDLSRVSTIFPVLITRDDIGGCWGISHYLQSKAEGFFNRQTVKPRTVTPIFSLSSEGIEGISAYLQDEPLSNLLHGWYRNDPGRYWSFQTIDNSVMVLHGSKNNSDLDTAFKAVFENARRCLFPDSNPTDI